MSTFVPIQGTLRQVSRALLNMEPGQESSHFLSDAKLIKSPLRYPGGKSRGVKQIIELFPPEITSLASPFFGGGSVELTCAYNGVQVYGYDAFEPLVDFWQESIKNAPKVAQLVYQYYPLTKSEFYALQKRYFNLEDRIERAAVFFALNRSSYSGTTLSGGMSPGHHRFTESSIERLANVQVDNLSVEHADFRDSLAQHEDDFLYLDPPYANGGNLYGKKGDMHKDFNHTDLSEILRARNGWILSYNDCEMVRDLYNGHRFHTPEWTYGMSKNKSSNEVLILSKDFVRVL